MSARFLAIASTMGADLSEADIRNTTEIVRRLSDEAMGRSERLPLSKRLAAPAREDPRRSGGVIHVLGWWPGTESTTPDHPAPTGPEQVG